jgi:DNA-binding SARP family transcriptional activator
MVTLRLLGGASLDGPDGPVTGRAALRHRLALLALLAVEHPRPLSRDKLLAYLWSESGAAEARHLLRSSLYILRSALGEDAVLSTGEDLRLTPDRLTSDLWEFEAALAQDDLEQAVAVYHGPFLSGFHLAEAEEFEHWVDREREGLAGRYRQALEQLAERETAGANPLGAVKWWARLAGEDRYNSRIALRYMEALGAAGDRAAALRHASAHSELLRADVDAAPDADVVALAERLRRESRPAANGAPPPARSIPVVPPTLDGSGEEACLAPAAPMPAQSARRGLLAPAALAVVVLALGLLGGSLTRARSPELRSLRVAAAPFENRTGRPDLDDLGPLAADWIIRGAMETPMLGHELEAVFARGEDVAGRPTDPIALARQANAEKVIRGSYYLSGDSILFLASVMDVASGRMLRSFDPVGAPLERAIDALEALRERIAVGIGPLVNPFSGGPQPVDPDLLPLPSLPAYREFVAGIKLFRSYDWETGAKHLRRAAELDPTFAAPLIQLAFHSTWSGDESCSLTDSIGAVLEPRRDGLSAWNRLTIDMLLAFCRGDMAEAVSLVGARFEAYPRSTVARHHYEMALESANRPRAAREILLGMDPEPAEGEYDWPRLAMTYHMTGEHESELAITDRWRDSADGVWREVRARTLAALGREREVRELLTTGDTALEAFAAEWLRIAAELAAHGHQRTATAMAESVMTRLKLEPDTGWVLGSLLEVDRLLGRPEHERSVLERIASTGLDSFAGLDVRGRIALLSGDTAQAEMIYRGLAEWSSRPLMGPSLRSSLILVRARMAAGLGRREEAVALLQIPKAGISSSSEHHFDPLLAPLRGYPPFEAFLKFDN